MANKRITQLPTAPQVEDNDYLAIDNTSTPTAENDGGTRKILVKDITAKSADAVDYDNTTSGLEADNVQDAIDEVLEEGGKVQDVYENGESVVDPTDKIARIHGHKEVTQAQYDALPSSKLTDGIMYCIKDADFSAEDVPYDNSDSGLESEDVQSAVDEIADVLGALKVEGTVENQSIATFPDGSALPMPKLEVSIEPQQDLHGYDAPWVGGAGKNKLDVPDGSMSQSGYIFNFSNLNLPAGKYTLNLKKTAIINFSLAVVTGETTPINTSISLPYSFEVTNTITGMRLYVGGAIDYSEVQLEEGTTATTFEPYSNICPISGWSAVDVNVSGVNVWDEQWEVGGLVNGTLNSKNFIPVIPNTTYFFTVLSEKYPDIYWYDENKNLISYISIQYNSTFTTPNNCRFIKFRMAVAYGTTYNNDISINYPSTDTSYHAYNGSTITIQLGDTYYGGKLDVVSGVLTVDWKAVNLNTLTWTYQSDYSRLYADVTNIIQGDGARTVEFINSDYRCLHNGEEVSQIHDGDTYTYGNTVFVHDSRYTDGTAFKNATTAKMVYPMATPLTIQLTPTQVNSLLGVNNIWADCGKINKAVYIRDLNIVINNLLNA